MDDFEPFDDYRPKQKVHVGRVRATGQPGFFTGNILVCSITEKQHSDKSCHRMLAKALGFELEEPLK